MAYMLRRCQAEFLIFLKASFLIMNRFFLLVFFACLSVFAKAQLAGDGYYRVQNNSSLRYIYVIDDKGKVNISTSDFDLYAIILWKNFSKAASDPASVIRIKPVGSQYDLMSQGTGIHMIVNTYASIRENSDGTYLAYATYDGVTKYLGDGEKGWSDDGVLTTSPDNATRRWRIIPVTQDDEHYFGVAASLQDGSDYYATLYADFSFDASVLPSHLSAYIVSQVAKGMAVIRPVTGEIAAGTPLLFKSNSPEPADNKLSLGLNSAQKNSSNLLQGVYFQNPSKSHYNQKAYDPNTMRVLGMMSDGHIGFVKSDIEYLPANKAYLVVPSDTPDELPLITEEDFTLGINEVDMVSVQHNDHGIYTLTGRKVADDAHSIDALPKGIYVINGKKVVLK